MAAREQTRLTRHGLYADIRGDAGAPALLFLHGGPGQGCYDFMAVQGGRLGGAARLIGIDQRGVDRSRPLPEGGTLTVADLVADCEELREALGIERWAVLGHSFGGMVALRYAASHPGPVTAVVFENPAVDMALASRAALPRVAALLTSLGRDEPARAALAALDGDRASAASPPERARALRLAYWTGLEAVGDQRESFFLPDPATRTMLDEIHAARSAAAGKERAAASGGGAASPGAGGQGFEPRDKQASQESTTRHQLAVLADPVCYEPGLPLLPRLAAPALLIAGGRDPVTSDELRAAFRAASPANRVLEFPQAGHFAHADDPAGYAAAVTSFLAGSPAEAGRPSP